MLTAAKMRRMRGTDTFEHASGGFVKYHDTVVVSWDNVPVRYGSRNLRFIRLHTGGWLTPATRRRMNQASDCFGLGFRVYQKDYVFYVDYRGKTYRFFQNEVRLEREG